ncbi:RNA-directed DNA polymerase, eukaryota, partial [Tanacetum coccineum]
MGDRRSKEDGVLNISTSIFVTNFPDQTNAKELWSLCNQYGNVIDAFIPNRRSKVGKRFGFIRFIKISDVERLVNNLCTIWIGKHKLHANIARFNRPPLIKGGYPSNVKANTKSAPVVNSNRNGASGPHNSCIQAAKAGTYSHSEVKVSKPALVLDESCLHEHDLGLYLVGKLKEFGSLPNLNKILMEEGFTDINIRYMGGFWGFQTLIYVDERVAWIEIKGVPLRAWSHNTFSIISSTWGDFVDELSEIKSEKEEIPETVFDEPKYAEFKSSTSDEIHKEAHKDDISEDPSKVNSNLEQCPLGGVNQAKGSACKENDSMTRHKESVNASGCSSSFQKVCTPKSGGSKFQVIEDLIKGSSGGTWLPNNKNMLIISVYAPQELAEKKMLWNYLNLVINRWKGDVIVMGDFNEVRSEDERYGSIFNARGAAAFNSFICTGGLLEVPTVGLIRGWVKGKKDKALVLKKELKNKLTDIDSSIDKGKTTSTILEERMAIMSNLSSLEKMESIELAQKAKVKWSIEGDENSKFFHGIINKTSKQFLGYVGLFNAPREDRFVLDYGFSPTDYFGFKLNRSRKKCFLKEENIVKFMDAVNHFFHNGFCHKGCNSSFIALIPKTQVTVIDGLVNGVQSAFIANSQILDDPFILNEIIHWCKAKKKQTMIFKVDFEKAFDSVRWDFFDDVLKNFGFGSRWREWIQSCLKSSRGSILVNGSLTSVIGSLYKIITKLLANRLVTVIDGLVNDDVVFIGQWCESNIATIIRVLDCFNRASGLHINLHKSKLLGLAVENDLVNLATYSIGCMTISLPFSYLGVNIGGHMSQISSWDVVIDKVLKRLSKWKMKALHGEDGKIGQPFKSSFTSNWAGIICSIPSLYNKGIDLLGFMKKKVGNRANTMFWQETWKGEAPFKIHFPRLFALESNKRITVEEKMKQPSIVSSFRHNLRGGIEQVQMDALSTILEDLILPNMKDRWSWSLSGDGEFFVSSARSFIDAKILETVGSKTQWCKYVPIKINMVSLERMVD